MAEQSIQMTYDAKTRRAVYTFKNGRTLGVSNVSEEQARRFLERDAPEFEKRDCCLHSIDGQFTREEGRANG